MTENFVENNENLKTNKKINKNNDNEENINENSNSDSVIINLKKVSDKKYNVLKDPE